MVDHWPHIWGTVCGHPTFSWQTQASSLFHLESLRKLNFCMHSCLRYNSESMRSLLWDGICGSWYPKTWVTYPNSLVLENIWKIMKIYNVPIKVAMFGMFNLASSVFFIVLVPLKSGHYEHPWIGPASLDPGKNPAEAPSKRVTTDFLFSFSTRVLVTLILNNPWRIEAWDFEGPTSWEVMEVLL